MNKLTINILGKGEGDGKKTAVHPSRKARRFGRRRVGGIRFWDLGYILEDEVYRTLPFIDPNSGNVIPHLSEVSPSWVTFEFLTTDHIDTLHGLIFDQPLATWKDTFYKIDNRYQLYQVPSVVYRGTSYSLGDADVWDGERFLPNGAVSDNSFAVNFGDNFFTAFSINRLGENTKVTLEQSPTADEVEFVPSRTMDIFMAPHLIKTRLEAAHSIVLPSADFTIEHMDYLREVYPREVIHDNSLDIYEYNLLGTHSYSVDSGSGGGTLEQYETVWNITEYWRANYGYRALRGQVDGLNDIITVIDPDDYASPLIYPEPPTFPTFPGANYLLTEFTKETAWPAPVLLAVILKGGVYYYVWSD